MVISANEINDKINCNSNLFIKESEENFAAHIRKTAEKISVRASSRPIILLSGPSGSGKTTSAMMIEKLLDESGFETHTLSMDNWFKPLSKQEHILLNNKKLDLESPDRVDSDFLSEQLTKIINCERVELPKFNFSDHTRENSGRILERKPGELVILEGIHALNPDVVKIPDENTERIYVSVGTDIEDSGGDVLHASEIRLMRRMLRDLNFRSRPVINTLKMFESVESGENNYIRPYKNRATVKINTFIPYEISVYKTRLLEKLRDISDNELSAEIVKFLAEILPIDEKCVPKTSLIREFIGNGQFEY